MDPITKKKLNKQKYNSTYKQKQQQIKELLGIKKKPAKTGAERMRELRQRKKVFGCAPLTNPQSSTDELIMESLPLIVSIKEEEGTVDTEIKDEEVNFELIELGGIKEEPVEIEKNDFETDKEEYVAEEEENRVEFINVKTEAEVWSESVEHEVDPLACLPAINAEVAPQSTEKEDTSVVDASSSTSDVPFLGRECSSNCTEIELNKSILHENMGKKRISNQISHHPVKRHKCPTCEYSSDRKRNLTNHMQVHTRDKPFKCSECDYVASLKSHIKLHVMNSHTRKTPFKCLECDFSAKDENKLKFHIVTMHTGEKPFKCTECDFSTREKRYIKQHILRIHVKAKPHKCPDCNFSAAQKFDLKIHFTRIHTSERPFKCTQCDYAGKRKCDVKRHIMSIHEGGKPHKCPECNFSAAQKFDVKIHFTRIHTTERPYKCAQCDYAGKRQKDVNTHMRRMHTSEKP